MKYLINNHSQERIDEYKKYAISNKEIDLYIENSKLSQYFYFVIMNFEIMLRNKINIELHKKYGNLDWRQCIKKDIKGLIITKKEMKLDINVFVSRKTFGFWNKIVQDLGNDIGFVYYKSKVERINKFRNRIFHFESIVKDLTKLNTSKNNLEELINIIGGKDYSSYVYSIAGDNTVIKKIEAIHITSI